MSLRQSWQFKFTAKDLSTAASNKCEHHQKRKSFWESAKAKVMAEVKDSGIEVSESCAGASYSNTGRGGEPQVMVRNDLQRKLTECHQKILEHDAKVKEYAGWVCVLNANH